MKKNFFNKFISNKFELFKTNKTSKESVLLIDRGTPTSIFSSSMIMQLVTKKFKLKPIIFSINSNESWQYKMYSAFGTFNFKFSREFFLSIRMLPLLFFSTFFSIYIFLKYRGKEVDFINNFSINSVNIGHLIYDDYIKDFNNYKKKKIFDLSFLIFLIKKNYTFFKISKILEHFNIKVLICNSIDYATHSSFAARIMTKKNYVVLIADEQFRIFDNYKDINKSMFHHGKTKLKKFFKNNKKKINFDSYVKKRFSGQINSLLTRKVDINTANKNKLNLSKKEFFKRYKISKDIDNVILIAPHIFGDAVHGFGKEYIFRDYYEQFVETIKFANSYEKDDILWLIKPHPATNLYKEDGQVEEVLKKFKNKKIILLDKKISTLCAVNISTLVVTGRGSIGLEAACMGKNVVIAGYAVYEGLGFTIKPSNNRPRVPEFSAFIVRFFLYL